MLMGTTFVTLSERPRVTLGGGSVSVFFGGSDGFFTQVGSEGFFGGSDGFFTQMGSEGFFGGF